MVLDHYRLYAVGQLENFSALPSMCTDDVAEFLLNYPVHCGK